MNGIVSGDAKKGKSSCYQLELWERMTARVKKG